MTFNLTKPGDVSTAGSEDQSDLLEALSLKERMARYQAAVSRGDTRSFSANVMEESDVCTVPGGLAKMKRQFEKDKMTSTCNAFSEYQYRHESRAEQEAIQQSRNNKKE